MNELTMQSISMTIAWLQNVKPESPSVQDISPGRLP